MAVLLKNKIQGNFVIVPRSVLNDKRLKAKDKGIMAVILGLSEGWNFNIRGLESITGEGRDSLITTIKRLKELKYLVEYQERDKNGKFARNIIEVRTDTNVPQTDKPYTAEPDTVEPFTGKLGLYNNKQINNNKINNKTDKKGGKEKDGGNNRKWTDAERELYGL